MEYIEGTAENCSSQPCLLFPEGKHLLGMQQQQIAWTETKMDSLLSTSNCLASKEVHCQKTKPFFFQ